MIASSNANHKSEPAGTPCFHADDGVFEDDGASRWSLELPGRFQEHVRRRLARKAEPSKIDAVHANVKELGEACRIEHRRTVLDDETIAVRTPRARASRTKLTVCS